MLLRRPPHFFGLSPVSLTAFWERASGPTALSLYAVAEDAGFQTDEAFSGVRQSWRGARHRIRFDPVVQRAINRVQGFDETAVATLNLRRAGIRSSISI